MTKQYESLLMLKEFFESAITDLDISKNSHEFVSNKLQAINDNGDQLLKKVTEMNIFQNTDPINEILYDQFLTVEDSYTDRINFSTFDELNNRIKLINEQSKEALTTINTLLENKSNALYVKKNKM